jgi:hypothetical protein
LPSDYFEKANAIRYLDYASQKLVVRLFAAEISAIPDPLRLGKMANGKNCKTDRFNKQKTDSTKIQVQISMFPSLNLEMEKNMTEAGGSKFRPRFASPVTTTQPSLIIRAAFLILFDASSVCSTLCWLHKR